MKTYSIRDWTMITISLFVSILISVSFTNFCFSPYEKSKNILIMR
jgi:hypothetical protein